MYSVNLYEQEKPDESTSLKRTEASVRSASLAREPSKTTHSLAAPVVRSIIRLAHATLVGLSYTLLSANGRMVQRSNGCASIIASAKLGRVSRETNA